MSGHLHLVVVSFIELSDQEIEHLDAARPIGACDKCIPDTHLDLTSDIPTYNKRNCLLAARSSMIYVVVYLSAYWNSCAC